MSFRLLDRSGTGHDAGAAAVDEESRFRAEALMPPRGLVQGRATLFAATASPAARCALVASAQVRVVVPPRVVYTPVTTLAPGGLVELFGLWWGTDRCDSGGDRAGRRPPATGARARAGECVRQLRQARPAAVAVASGGAPRRPPWGPATCGSKANPIAIELQRNGVWEFIGTATPNANGSIDVVIVPQPPAVKDQSIRGIQSACEPQEPPYEATAKVRT